MNSRYWRRVIQGVMLGVAVLCLATSLTNTSPVTAARASLAPAGVTLTFGIDEGGVLSGNSAAAVQAAATGVNWVRGEISWRNLESTPGVYSFMASQPGIDNFINAGLSPVMYIADNPTWAANTHCGPVDTKDDSKVTAFANAMGALAAHYPNVQVWALYNEVDRSRDPEAGAGCFGSSTSGGVNDNGVKDSHEYAIMLAAAWKAVHDANPNAKLVMGAMAYDNFDAASAPNNYPGGGNGGSFNYNFATEVFNYMKSHPLPNNRKYMDMVLFNYYDIYGRYWEKNAPGRGLQAKAAAMTNKIKAHGIPTVPLFVTETGEDSLSIGKNVQAQCLDITFVRGAAAKLQGIIWWTFKDLPDSAPPPYNTWKFGIVDQDFIPKPSYTALQTLTTELNGYKYKKNWSGTWGFSNLEAYMFKSGKKAKYVVWSSSYKSTSYDPECSWARNSKPVTFLAKTIRVVDYLGKAKTIKDNSKKDKNKTKGEISIVVTGAPKIITINP